MLEAVLAVAGLAADADAGEGVDVGFAGRVRALGCGEEGGLSGVGGRGGCFGVFFPAGSGPGAGVGAFV